MKIRLPSLALVVAGSVFVGCSGSDDASPVGTGGASAGGTGGSSAGAAGTVGSAGAAGTSGGSGGATSGGSGGTTSGGSGGSPDGFRAALGDDGFAVQDGAFSFLDLSMCCLTSCLGNNPSSPYAAFYVPKSPSQPAPEPGANAGGLSASFHLREDEAIVYVGATPPKARYFGFTPYLVDRQDASGKVTHAFASLSETLNDGVIGVDGGPDPFERPTVVIASLDEGVDQRVRAALVKAGYPTQSLNSLVFDPTVSKPGLDAGDDTYGVLFRMAVFDDPAKGQAYRDMPPGFLWRVTPMTPATPQPFPAPVARPKNLADSEAGLTPKVDALEQAIAAAYPDHVGKVMFTTKGQPDPAACIAGTDACAYDNRDTIYPATLPQALLSTPDEFLVVYGVNHETTGKAAYASASVYATKELVGVTSVTSATYGGSAAQYLPNDPDVGHLYAWKIARSCAGDPACLEVPVGTCPTGIPDGASMDIAFRVYLEPKTSTAADPSTLVIDRVMRLQKK